jgi:hypothetical protein
VRRCPLTHRPRRPGLLARAQPRRVSSPPPRRRRRRRWPPPPLRRLEPCLPPSHTPWPLAQSALPPDTRACARRAERSPMQRSGGSARCALACRRPQAALLAGSPQPVCRARCGADSRGCPAASPLQVLIRPNSKVIVKFLQVMQKHGECSSPQGGGDGGVWPGARGVAWPLQAGCARQATSVTSRLWTTTGLARWWSACWVRAHGHTELWSSSVVG